MSRFTFEYDRDADAGHFRLLDEAAYRGRYDSSFEVRPGVILDFDQDEKLIGIEILGVSKTAPALLPDSEAVDTAAE